MPSENIYMTYEHLILYIGIMLSLAIVPGPSMILAFTEGAMFGVVGTIPTALGNMTAALIQALVSFIIFRSIAVAIPDWFIFIQIIGAAYILYLGYLLIREKNISRVGVDQGYLYKTPLMRFTNGFLVSFFNPKSIFFFVAIFSQIIPINVPINLEEIMKLTFPVIAVSFGVFLGFSYCGKKMRALIGDQKLFTVVVPLMGLILIVIGVYAALEPILTFGSIN